MGDVVYVCQDRLSGEFYTSKDLDSCEQHGDTALYAGTKEEILKDIAMDIEDLQREYERVKELLNER